MGIGSRIRELRKAKGLTQKQLGERCGMADSAIRFYESGRGNPTHKTIERIANALGVHILDLVGMGEELDKFQITLTDVRPLAGEPQDVTPEKIAEPVELMNTLGYRGMYDSLSDADKVTFWKNVEQPFRAELDELFTALNDKGQEKVVEYARDLLPTHRRPDTLPAPPEGTDTTPTVPPPESAEDGK